MVQKCDIHADRLIELRQQVNMNDFVYRKYKQKGSDNTWHLICAILDRLDITVKYLNNIEFDWKEEFAIFKFCELLNYTCQIKDMVYKLADIFSVNLYNICETKDIFGDVGNEKGSDDKYINYLRSICAIHPISTSRHINAGYQDSEEFCPYLSKGNRFNSLFGHGKEEICITIYRNDLKLLHNKHVFIRFEDVLKYLYQRYEKIDLISKQINKLRNEEN